MNIVPVKKKKKKKYDAAAVKMMVADILLLIMATEIWVGNKQISCCVSRRKLQKNRRSRMLKQHHDQTMKLKVNLILN